MNEVEPERPWRLLSGVAGSGLDAVASVQWLKNLLVFAALIFSQHLFVAQSVARALLAFASFCLLASASYLMNDVHDAEKRPAAPDQALAPDRREAGRPRSALSLARLAGLGGVALACGLGPGFAEILRLCGAASSPTRSWSRTS